jgi:hypothetical protein
MVAVYSVKRDVISRTVLLLQHQASTSSETEILQTGVYLSHGGAIPESESFQQYFYDRYKIVVYTGLRCDLIMYGG